MTQLAKLHDVTAEQPKPGAIARLDNANKRAVDFVFGAQRIFLDEFVFLGDEVLDRFQAETHLLAEYISKLAGSHSVRDLKTMCRECGQHQLDFVRRDCERMFRHGERMIRTTSELVDRPSRTS